MNVLLGIEFLERGLETCMRRPSEVSAREDDTNYIA